MARFSPFSISISWAGLQALREPPETEHELGEAVALDILGGEGFHSSSQAPTNSPGRSNLLYRVKLGGYRLRNSFHGSCTNKPGHLGC